MSSISHTFPLRSWAKVGADIFHFQDYDYLMTVDRLLTWRFYPQGTRIYHDFYFLFFVYHEFIFYLDFVQRKLAA